MRKLLLLLSLLLVVTFSVKNTYAQRTCAAHDHLMEQMSKNPQMQKAQDALESYTKEFVTKWHNSKAGATRIIPIYVHVIYANATENISDAQIQSQIDVLNADYGGTNFDLGSTPSEFAKAGNTGIQFVLAGIDRKSSTKTSWGTADAMKKSAQGGVNPITPDTHLNMWICNIGGGILGYAQFPGGSSATDGVVFSPQYCGSKVNPTTGGVYPGSSTFYLSAPFDKGRTATHEIGHYLNLRHIWGDGNCSATDYVTDTPPAAAANYNCPSYPSKTCTATTGFTSDMFMNYMDYTDDGCMFMFSVGQSDRMWACLTSTRVNLGTGSAPTPTAPTATTVAASSVSSNGAILNGTVNANNASTTVSFEYGLTTAYGSTAAAVPATVTGATATGVTATLTGLTVSTTYNYRVKTVNSVGTTYGANMTFTTSAAASSPTVTTTAVSGILSNGATTGGNITANGGATVTVAGVCYATTTNPTTSNSVVTTTATSGAFTSTLSGLTASTTYYVRAYATNSAGTSYGAQVSFTTAAAGTGVDVTVGTGTTTQRYPLGFYYGYERSASLYTSAEIAKAGTISKLAWYPTVTSTTSVPVKIYIKTTTATKITASTWTTMTTGATLVYSGTLAGTTANVWKEIALATSFNYTSGNLLVLVETNYGGAGTGTSTSMAVRYSTATSKHMYIQADNTAPTAKGTVGSSRPNVKLTFSTVVRLAAEEQVIEEVNAVVDFKIYPNPATDVVSFNLAGDKDMNVQIFSITGTKIYENRINATENTVNVSNFAAGTYFVRILNGEKIFTGKFIKE